MPAATALSVDQTENHQSAEVLPVLRSHMPELDTLRGLAILGVLLYHGLYWTRDLTVFPTWERRLLAAMSVGQFGVNLFFVLSGFLITGILLDSRVRPDYYGRFYYRRGLRILPVYYLTLLLLVILGITSRGFLLMSLVYLSNLSPMFGIAMSYTVLWTLAVEEHFYLLWPMFVRRLSFDKLLWILGAILVITPVSRFLYYQHAVRTGTIGAGYGYYTWNNMDGLALGGIVAILVRMRKWERPQVLKFAVAMCVLAFAATAAGYPFGILTRRNGVGEAIQHVPMNLLFAGLLGFFLVVGTGQRRRWAAPASMVFLGKISYGLYLYHMMAFGVFDWIEAKTGMYGALPLGVWGRTWLRMIVTCVGVILFAYLSRNYFEEPFLRMKDKSVSRGTAKRSAV